MKKMNILKAVFAIALSFTLVNCTSEDPIPGPMGAQGAAGVNGTNGTNGTNGADGSNVCLSCHNIDYKVIQPATNLASGHKIGAALPGRNNACLNCHSNEGYLASYKTSDLTTTFTTTATTQTVIDCKTCHSGGHGSAGLAVSGKDAALRTVDAYKLAGVGSVGTVIDFKNNSNSCIHCHQVRRAGAGYTVTVGSNPATVGISSSFGPHYGGATNMLQGIDANEIAGTVAYPAAGSNAHGKNASCTSCHMGKAKDGKGNHSMKPVLDNCKTCHTGSGVVNYDINGGQTKIKNLMKDLAKEIVRLQPANFSLNDGVADPTQKDMLVMPATGTRQVPELISKAVFNYRFLYQDHSYGLHNPKYAEALMRNTIAALKALP